MSGKSNKRIFVYKFAISAWKWLKIAVQEKRRFVGLGQDQQQHPAVHTGPTTLFNFEKR